MKKTLSLMGFFMFLMLTTVVAQETKTEPTTKDKKVSKATLVKEFSYSYGYSFARDLKEKSSFEANEMVAKYILKGLKDGLKVDTGKLSATNGYLDQRLKEGVAAKTEEEGNNTSYNLGYNAIANMMVMLELPSSDFHYGFLKKGYTDFTKGKESKFKAEVMEAKLTTYFEEKQQAMQDKMLAKRKAQAAEMLVVGEKYLAENAKKEGIKTTASGLQYQVIKEGTGAKPNLESTVVTHYTGTLMDGKVFDSSIERGSPATFPLNAVIKGWQEGIPLMTVGSRYRLFVPASLGYGENSPASIPPNSVLIFDVELLEILKADPNASDKSKMSYSYGFMVGKSLERVPFEQSEKDPNQFVQGFAKGFSGSEKDAMAIEGLLKARMEAKEAAKDPEAAKKIAFGIGFSSSAAIALQIGALVTEFDLNAVGMGYSTALEGGESKFSDDEMNGFLKAYFEPRQAKVQSKMKAEEEKAAGDNIAAGKKFMEENAKKEGVVKMENGMQYIVLKKGEGTTKPTLQNKVTTHYHGMLIDGTVFDSSVDRGEPATFPLNGVIKGWQEGIPLMSVGAKYKFFIPANLAYGNKQMGPTIPAGSTLIFEVELIEIN